MIREKKFTCILCPIGCETNVHIDNSKFEFKGLKCNKGKEYVINELNNPKRMLTTTVFVEGGVWPLVSVKTSQPIPKEKIFKVLYELKKKKIIAPVFIGQKIIKNVLNTGVDILATRTILKKIEK